MKPIVILFSFFSYLMSCPVSAQDRANISRSSDQNGRYVITFSPLARADTFLLDTQTGKVWRLTRFVDVFDEPSVFLKVDRLDSDLQISTWFETHPIIKAKPRISPGVTP